MKSWYTTVSSSDCRGAYSYANTHMMAVVVNLRVLLYDSYSSDFWAYSFTNTLGMVVVVRQNVCGVRVWSGIRHISIIQGLWRKLRAQYQRNVESVCTNVNLSDFRVPFSTQVHILC
jgi:hypothetical protein